MAFLYLFLKTLHIFGFVVAYGINICTFFAYRHFWKLYDKSRESGLAAFRTFRPIYSIGMCGLITVITAGIVMIVIAGAGILQPAWFRWKLALVILVFINGFTYGRTATLALYAITDDTASRSDILVAQTRRNLRRFQLVQMVIYAVIIALSIFRP